MRNTVLLALILPALVAAAISSASAQGAETALPPGAVSPRDEGSLYRGAYEVTEDGSLIYGGDVEYGCEDLVAFGAPAKPDDEGPTADGKPLEPLTRGAVELCVKAGFPPEGAVLDVPAPASAPATTDASASASGAAAGGGGTLPETGGVAPSLLPAATVAAAGALLLTLRARSWIARGGR